jgi:hypothetical protein
MLDKPVGIALDPLRQHYIFYLIALAILFAAKVASVEVHEHFWHEVKLGDQFTHVTGVVE